MKKPKRKRPTKAQIKRLLAIGDIASNICWNIAHGTLFGKNAGRQCMDVYKAWDEARNKLK